MAKKDKHKSHFHIRKETLYVVVTLFLIIAVPIFLIGAYWGYFSNRIYPNVSVNGLSLSGQTQEEAQLTMANSFMIKPIVIASGGEEYEINPEEVSLLYDFNKTAKRAYEINRSGNLLEKVISSVSSVFIFNDIELSVDYDEDLFDESISIITGQAVSEAIYPSITSEYGVITVNKGSAGTDVNKDLVKELVLRDLRQGHTKPISLPVKTVNPEITDAQAEVAKIRAEKLKNKKLTYSFERKNFTYDFEDIITLLDPAGGYYENHLENLLDDLALQIERPPQNPVFDFKEGRVVEFIPAKTGVEMNRMKMSGDTISQLMIIEDGGESSEITVAASETDPEITTGEVNDLGIKELLGRGNSTYRGSIANRIYNIGVASSKFNGVLIKPGENISFNEIVGDISVLTGYKQAYVISGGKTILGDGGGVCQVSTTLFRAGLDAGLPITERRPHSYRVTYYEQNSGPGLDATIYSPTTDLKMLNDTPGHLLIQSYYDPKAATLDFEIYGTSDGRVSTITEPVITSQSAPPPDEYSDDPTKPEGYIEQVDWANWGAKVNFDYTVERGGEVIYEKTFHSNYRPWSNKFIRGTGPIQ